VRYRFACRVITTCAWMATLQANWLRDLLHLGRDPVTVVTSAASCSLSGCSSSGTHPSAAHSPRPSAASRCWTPSCRSRSRRRRASSAPNRRGFDAPEFQDDGHFATSRYVALPASRNRCWGSVVATRAGCCVRLATTSSQRRERHDTVRARPAEWGEFGCSMTQV
jgi:hypothetical protein